MAAKMAAVKHYNWLQLSHLLIQRLRFFTELCLLTAHIRCRSLTQIGLQNPRWRTKWHRNNRTIQNSIKYKASEFVLHNIRQVAAGTKREYSDKKYSTFASWQHLILPLFDGGLHMCVCCCTCVAYVCAYVREKVMFEVYGGESGSMSDQYGIYIFCF